MAYQLIVEYEGDRKHPQWLRSIFIQIDGRSAGLRWEVERRRTELRGIGL